MTRIFSVFVLFSLASCKNQKGHIDNNPISESSAIQLDSLMPQDVKNYLKTNFPDYHIPDTNEYFKNFSFFFNKGVSYSFNDQIPYFVTSDFNDDQLPDFAFILKKSENLKFVFLENTGNSFKYWSDSSFNEPIDNEGIIYGLYVEPPRKIDCVVDDEPVSLILKRNGVALYKLEDMMKVYYWEDGTFKVFRTK